MSSTIRWAAVAVLAAVAAGDAAAQGRQYYDPSWTYNQDKGYYYRKYHYTTTTTVTTTTTYSYDYTIYYPKKPQYVYYYNPRKNVYWGRYDVGTDGKGVGYSLLAEADKKEKLADIPESAFPKPAEMPVIPGATDGVRMTPPPLTDLPTEAPK